MKVFTSFFPLCMRFFMVSRPSHLCSFCCSFSYLLSCKNFPTLLQNLLETQYSTARASPKNYSSSPCCWRERWSSNLVTVLNNEGPAFWFYYVCVEAVLENEAYFLVCLASLIFSIYFCNLKLLAVLREKGRNSKKCPKNGAMSAFFPLDQERSKCICLSLPFCI